MDERELCEAILHEQSGGELPTRWKCTMMDAARCTLGAADPSLQRTMTFIKGFLCFSTTIVVHRSLM
jgi:hypothetical protein